MFNSIKGLFKKQDKIDFNNLKNVNIAYVLYGFPTLSQTFVINELRWLKENGYNVKVLSYGDPGQPVDLDFEIENLRFDGEDLIGNLERLLIDENIELMHSHFVFPCATLFTLPLSSKLNIPFTVFAHAADIFRYEIDRINRITEIGQSDYCKAIFTLGDFHKNHLLDRGVPEEKIVITKQATNYEVSEINHPNNKIKSIVAISRFVEKKGLDDLIDIADILKDKDYEFSIYGFGDLEDELNLKINGLNLTNISVKGKLDGALEVREVLNNADLLVSPCKRAHDGDLDGIPTVIFEAMGYGTPVLTTDVSAIPEIIQDGVNGFIVEANDKEAFSDKINEIMSLGDDELMAICTKAQEDVQNISSVEKTMNTVINTWKNIN